MTRGQAVLRIVGGLLLVLVGGSVAATFYLYYAWRTATPDTPEQYMLLYQAYAHFSFFAFLGVVIGGLFILGGGLLPWWRARIEARRRDDVVSAEPATPLLLAAVMAWFWFGAPDMPCEPITDTSVAGFDKVLATLAVLWGSGGLGVPLFTLVGMMLLCALPWGWREQPSRDPTTRWGLRWPRLGEGALALVAGASVTAWAGGLAGALVMVPTIWRSSWSWPRLLAVWLAAMPVIVWLGGMSDFAAGGCRY